MLPPLFAYSSPYSFFFFNDTATTEIYTLSLHDALPIWICLAAAGAGCGHRLLRRKRSAHSDQPLAASHLCTVEAACQFARQLCLLARPRSQFQSGEQRCVDAENDHHGRTAGTVVDPVPVRSNLFFLSVCGTVSPSGATAFCLVCRDGATICASTTV